MTEGTGDVVVTTDGVTLARDLAELFVRAAREATDARGRFDVALAGGSTPKAAYDLLASPALRDAVAWRHVRFFFGDERCVPPDDDQSNYKMAANALLRPLEIPESAVFRMRGEDDPPAAARAYADVLRAELPFANGAPQLDLVMLGMGPDGHTASLFPGADPYADSDALVRAPFVAKFDSYRLTVTPRVIGNARAVAVAAAGVEKAAALATALRPGADPRATPVAVVKAAAGRVTWLVDRAAAGGALPTDQPPKR